MPLGLLSTFNFDGPLLPLPIFAFEHLGFLRRNKAKATYIQAVYVLENGVQFVIGFGVYKNILFM